MIRRATIAAALSGLPILLGCSAGEEEPVADTVEAHVAHGSPAPRTGGKYVATKR